MDDLELIRDLGRELEHEPAPSLLRQRERLMDATAAGWRRGPGRWTLFGAVAAVAAAAVTAVAILVPAALTGGDARPAGRDITARNPGKTFNLLVIGSDTRPRANGARSDTIVMVHVPADRKNIRAVSVPRDLLVDDIPCRGVRGKGRAPINTSFSQGGAACTRTALESLTKARFDQTVVVDFNGFKGMVDALGGVDVTLPHAVSDPAAKLKLPRGKQRLNGTQALAYVRTRRSLGDGSDIARVRRQLQFMEALTRRAKEQQRRNPARFGRFLAVAAGSVEATPRWDLRSLRELAGTFTDTGVEDVEFAMLPVRAAPEDSNRLALDPAAAERTFAPFRG
ncbi:LytR family transcriptional attenuator [Actinomadura pelletieri DSM 43383]|uniref:LytR family transcriptional attenuator n=1 Tax=Actinomadura pelletieri DSM 43383 TaxID=1120940 RepID=A0A495QSY1_9ACTN|nr:LCP family protein [Actinomadura pelletieri]RKS76605.1 LytR family transcriptional attenuator [Actinomadura pelletieri DSM 43383]